MVGLVFLLIKLSKDRSDELSLFGRLTKIISKVDDKYRWLIDSHLQLPSKLNAFLDEKLDLIKNNGRGGLIFFNVCSNDYLNWLTQCIADMQKSFEAILTYPYKPSWFFIDDSEMNLQKKMEYLNVTNKRSKKTKCRILVYKYNDLKIDFEFMKTRGFVEDFLRKHKYVELLFLDLTELEKPEYLSFKQQIMLAITKDYAMVDRKIVLRKQDSVELAVYLGKNDFLALFSDQNRQLFTKPLVYNKKEIIDEFNLIP